MLSNTAKKIIAKKYAQPQISNQYETKHLQAHAIHEKDKN